MDVAKRAILFPVFWYVDAPRKLLRLFYRLVVFLDQKLAASLMLGMLFTPLFGDPTIVGRSIGFVFRLVRAVFGFAAIFVFSICYLIFFVSWLIAPWYGLFFLGGLGWLGVVGIFGLYLLMTWNKPFRKVSGVGGGNIEQALSPELRGVWGALDEENQAHFLKKLVKLPRMRRLAHRLGIESIRGSEAVSGLPAINLGRDDFIKVALDKAKELGSKTVNPEHAFFAICEASEEGKKLLSDLDLKLEHVAGTVFWMADEDRIKHPPLIWSDEYEIRPMGGVNRGWTSRPTPTLDRCSIDLTKLAERGKLAPVIGKDKAIEEAIRVLSRSSKDNVLVVGDPGCGKTTMIGGLAQEIIAGTKAKALRFKRLVSLDTSALIGSASNLGDLNQTLVTIINEIKAAGNIILFVDEIHNMVASMEGFDPNIATIFSAFEPHLSAGEFQFVGATNASNYKKFIEPNEAFARVFQVVRLEPAGREAALKILERISLDLERRAGVVVSYSALSEAVDLSEKLIHDRVLPDKAVDLLDEAIVKARDSKQFLVTSQMIEEIASERTKVPVAEVRGEESKRLLELEKEIHRRIIDQNEAIDAIADAMRRARVGLREERRPIASFLFVGPTGVGKTETAKALAEAYFGGEQEIVRLDMSEYQDQDSVSKLIGASPGREGAEEGGQLTEKVRHKPFCLILLDEIEKAHPDILLLFLQVLDDARLTDSLGRTVDFSNTIIIATSNVGTSLIQEKMEKGFDFEAVRRDTLQEVEKRFKPEFLNRFSGLIVFQPLGFAEVKEIVKLLLGRVEKRLEGKEISLIYSDEVLERVAREGFDPKWGARPLRRLIENKIESPLAKKILAGELKKGDSVNLHSLLSF